MAAQAGAAPAAVAVRPIPHVRQLKSWDCGLACVCAITNALTDAVESLPELTTACSVSSLWTIDLCLLLHARGVTLSLFTDVPGVNPSHSDLAYYSALEDDAARVTDGFQRAKSLGIRITTPAPDIDYVCERLAARLSVFVMLIDLRFLSCTRCGPRLAALTFTYAGHYVVLTHYDFSTDEIEYMDPAADAHRCYASVASVERARTSAGTDRDLLEVPMPR